jgi:hypothetical protein
MASACRVQRREGADGRSGHRQVRSAHRQVRRLLKRGAVNLVHRQAVASGREDVAIDRLLAREGDRLSAVSDQPARGEPVEPGSDEFSDDEFLSCDSNGGA